jgi:hypothetical protein
MSLSSQLQNFRNLIQNDECYADKMDNLFFLNTEEKFYVVVLNTQML